MGGKRKLRLQASFIIYKAASQRYPRGALLSYKNYIMTWAYLGYALVQSGDRAECGLLSPVQFEVWTCTEFLTISGYPVVWELV